MAKQNRSDKRQEKPFKQVVLRRWDKLIRYYNRNFSNDDKRQWGFRAQQTPNKKDFQKWSIKSAFEKAEYRYDPQVDLIELEKELIRSFQRRAHHYVTQPPDKNDLLEWLSLMRHLGGPTRFIDFSYSFYVAMYLAINDCDCSESKPEIWVLDLTWLSEQNENGIITKIFREARNEISFRSDTEYANEVLHILFYRKPTRVLYHVSPFRQNERITAQQGTFVFPGRITQDSKKSKSLAKKRGVFFDNLTAYKQASQHLHRIVLDIPPQERNHILKELHRMNINQAVLFPDLQGFAESLTRRMACPELLGIKLEETEQD